MFIHEESIPAPVHVYCSVNRKLLLYFCLWVICAPSFAQQADRLLRINYDNDYFSATDRYYTQGVRIELIAPFVARSLGSRLLVRPANATHIYHGMALERDGFTPRSIRHAGIYEDERPYAGTMFLSHFAIALNAEKKSRITSQFDLGLIGPAVGGKQEQTAIHRAIGNIEPLGWEYQVANDAIINYTLQYDKGIVSTPYAELIGLSQLRAGTLCTDAGAGAMVRAGLFSSYFDDIGLSKTDPQRKFQCYGIAKGLGKLVVYNATMQGGMFNRSSVYTLGANDLERWVVSGSAGIVLAYKNVSLEYTKTIISPEFKGGLSHGWGHCNISIAF
jgi:lipid A 3-O-deacylase